MDLTPRWAAVAGAWGAPAATVERVGASLVGRYDEPHRHYHTVAHLRGVLDALFVDLAADPTAVELAAWFHDAIYDPRSEPGVNEAASADLAAAELGSLRAPEATVAAVTRLVLLTTDHDVEADDRDGAVLSDADLSILGASPSVYRGYAAAVRGEYGWLTGEEWQAGRSRVLRRLLDRPRLYVTERGTERWERAARANLAAELARLLAEA